MFQSWYIFPFSFPAEGVFVWKSSQVPFRVSSYIPLLSMFSFLPLYSNTVHYRCFPACSGLTFPIYCLRNASRLPFQNPPWSDTARSFHVHHMENNGSSIQICKIPLFHSPKKMARFQDCPNMHPSTAQQNTCLLDQFPWPLHLLFGVVTSAK